MTTFYGGVEGRSDIAVLKAVAASLGVKLHTVFDKRGKPNVLKQLSGWNRSAQYSPWMVVVDLDVDYEQPGDAARAWLAQPAAYMSFTIAVREMEAWLLGDDARIARFLGVARSLIPEQPEDLRDPKLTLINLARKSNRRDIREGLVPRPGSGRSIGATYVSDISIFAEDHWRPNVAAASCPSLARFLKQTKQVADSIP